MEFQSHLGWSPERKHQHYDNHILLQCSMFPVLCGKNMRLVHQAKQCCNVTIREFAGETSKEYVMIQLVSEFSGGTGEKESQRAFARNSLASTLLDQGFSLDWVPKTTNKIVEKAGLKRILQISQLPPGKQRSDEILKMCGNCGLSPLPHLTKSSQQSCQCRCQQDQEKSYSPGQVTLRNLFSSLKLVNHSHKSSKYDRSQVVLF